MPDGKLAEDFHPELGRPTKDEGTTSPVIKLLIPTSGRKQADVNSEGDQPSAGNSSGDDHKITSSKPTEDHSLMLTILGLHDDKTSNRLTRCPAGHELHRAHDCEHEDQHLLLMLTSNQDPCRACPLRPRGPMRYDAMLGDLPVNRKDLRLALRRAAEDTEDFQAEYQKQGGIEATNEMLKRVTGFGCLRICGRPAVTMSTL